MHVLLNNMFERVSFVAILICLLHWLLDKCFQKHDLNSEWFTEWFYAVS